MNYILIFTLYVLVFLAGCYCYVLGFLCPSQRLRLLPELLSELQKF